MASSTEAISLAVEHVSVTYPNGHQAIRDVTFTLQGRTVCALVGVNGSGKSTLFNTIMGIIRPQTGAVRVNGLPVAQAMRQNGIAYVPQSENIDWHFPILVKDVVMLGRYGHMGFLRRARPQDHAAVAAALERLGIARHFSQPTRMIWRQLERRPGKALFAIIALAAAGGIVVVGNFQRGSVNYMIGVENYLAQQHDISVSFIEDAPPRALYELAAMRGVRAAEGQRSVAVRVAHDNRQKRLILEAWRLLKPGGTLVYSTCTMAPEENEVVVDWLLRRQPDAALMPITITPLPDRVSAVQSWNNRVLTHDLGGCLRLMPGRLTEAFFVAAFRKTPLAESMV